METRLNKEVSRMRNQVMSFTNEGAEFQLNVPDTNEVKDVFGEVVTTVVSHQKQLSTLQSTLQEMSEDHLRSQEALIAWATACITGLMHKNNNLEHQLEDTMQQLKNLSYNMQGYYDETKAEPTPIHIDITPPGLFKTKTPAVVKDPKDIYTEEGEDKEQVFFHTSTGAETDLSFIEARENAREGGPIKLQSSAQEIVEEKKHRKTDVEKQQALFKYKTTKEFLCPVEPAKRWRWAIKKVMRENRQKTHLVGMTRGKLPERETIANKMKRMDQVLYHIPVELRRHVHEETTKINERIDVEVQTLQTELEGQKVEYTEMGQALQVNIDTSNLRIDDVDKRLNELKEQVENSNKQQEEMEAKVNKVIARVNEEESLLFQSLKCRVQEATEKLVQLQGSGSVITNMISKLNEAAIDNAPPENYENDNERIDFESKKLFSMLEFETQLRATRNEITLLDSNCFSVNHILKHVRREILALSPLAGGDYEAIVPKETVNELLALVDSGFTTCEGVFETVNQAMALWTNHDQLLSHRWSVLAGMAEAAKSVATIATQIESITTTLSSLPDENRVGEIANESITTALQPVITSIEEVDIKALKANSETIDKLTQIDTQHATALEAMKVELMETFNTLQATRTEVLNSREGTATGGGGGTVDIETQLEPMIKDIVEMYVNHAPPSRHSTKGNDPSGGAIETDFFGTSSIGESTAGGLPDQEVIMEGSELELLLGLSSAEAINDELDDENERDDRDSIGDNSITELTVGGVVRIKKKDSPYFGYKGIISGIIGEEAEEGSIQASTGNVAEADGGDGGSAEQKEPDNDSQKIVKVTYKVTITPKTPGGLKTFSRSGDPNDEFVALDLHQHEGKMFDQGTMQEQLALLSHKVEELIQGKIPMSGAYDDLNEGSQLTTYSNNNIDRSTGVRPESTSPLAVDTNRGVSFAGSPAHSPHSPHSPHGGHVGAMEGSMTSGVPSRFGGSQSYAGTQSMADTSQFIDLIQDSMKAVSQEIGDLKQSSQRELQQAKNQMRKAILAAINKAIVEEAEKDKPAMLSTKALCVGCGRPSLVRGVPFEQSLTNSNKFNPSLNGSVQPGPDIYRGGFKMPVSKNSLHKLAASPLQPGTKVFNEDSLFGEDDNESHGHASMSTYSEILANIDHRDGVTNITDVGPGGLSISITSTTAPIRQMSYPARKIAHAQGKEEASMLRPIHRKGFPGKTSEKARQGVNKTWAPERLGEQLSLSPSAISIPRPKMVSKATIPQPNLEESSFQP